MSRTRTKKRTTPDDSHHTQGSQQPVKKNRKSAVPPNFTDIKLGTDVTLVPTNDGQTKGSVSISSPRTPVEVPELGRNTSDQSVPAAYDEFNIEGISPEELQHWSRLAPKGQKLEDVEKSPEKQRATSRPPTRGWFMVRLMIMN